jgi:hypothetical protein
VFLEESDLARLSAVQRSLYKAVDHLMANTVTLFLDNTYSMLGTSQGESFLRIMVGVVRELVGAWSNDVQVRVVLVAPPHQTSLLARFHRKICSRSEVLGPVCAALEKAALPCNHSLEYGTALCDGLLGIHRVGPTVIITDGEETEHMTLRSILPYQLPIYKARITLTVGQAVARHNRALGSTHALPHSTEPFPALLQLLKVYNPNYFLATVVHTAAKAHPPDESGLVYHYHVSSTDQATAVAKTVNRTTVPVECGGPVGTSQTLRRLVLARARGTSVHCPRLQDLASYTVVGGDTRNTWRILAVRRFYQLRRPGYSPPGTARVSTLDATSWMQFMSRHLRTIEEEARGTEVARRDFAARLLGHPVVRRRLYRLNMEHITTKNAARGRRRKGRAPARPLEFSSGEMQLLLQPPSIIDEAYTAFLSVRDKFAEHRIEIRSPSDWLTAKMTVDDPLFVGLFPGGHEGDTLHEHVLRGLPVTPLDDATLALFLYLPVAVRRLQCIQECATDGELFVVAESLAARDFPGLHSVLRDYARGVLRIERDSEIARDIQEYLEG